MLLAALLMLASIALASPADDLDALERLVLTVHPAPFRYTARRPWFAW